MDDPNSVSDKPPLEIQDYTGSPWQKFRFFVPRVEKTDYVSFGQDEYAKDKVLSCDHPYYPEEAEENSRAADIHYRPFGNVTAHATEETPPGTFKIYYRKVGSGVRSGGINYYCNLVWWVNW